MTLLKEFFVKPEDKYTPYPFWFWNGDLSIEEIERQIDEFYEKGIRGFIIHPRMGLPKRISYLSDVFFSYVSCAVEKAATLGMKVILYDEGMYPSGSANGKVVRDFPEYASKGIYVTTVEDFKVSNDFQKILLSFKFENEQVKFIENDSEATHYLIHQTSLGTIRGIHFGEDDGEKNAPRSTDLLNTNACRYFIECTHDKYFEKLGKHFGETIIAFFTDEPDILGRNHLPGMLPYNEELAAKLVENQIELIDLPNLFFTNESNKNLRRKYDNLIIQQLEESYYEPISQWCESHGIALTGHPHSAHAIGLEKHFHIPGQDVVWRWVAPEKKLGICGAESVTAKSASDAARHNNRERNANECFGCCGSNGYQWSFSTDDMKWYLDWLFIRGCNLIIPHAFFYSIEGERKNERAPDVGINNLWWPHFNYFSDYIKRMSFMMSNQYNLTNIALICESDFLPYDGINQLYQNQLEFNYLEADYLLSSKYELKDEGIVVANQIYNVIVVEEQHTQFKKLMKELIPFSISGGHVIVVAKGERVSDYLIQLDQLSNKSVKITGQKENLRYIEFIKDETFFIALANEGETEIGIELEVPEGIQSITLWDPWKATIQQLEILNKRIKLFLPRRMLFFVTLSEEVATSKSSICRQYSFEPVIEIDVKDSKIDSLGDWTKMEELSFFSGTIDYQLTFSIPEAIFVEMPEQVVLDLGRVENITELFIDGQAVEVVFWSPYQFNLSKEMLRGHEITVAVTNTLTNQLDRNSQESGLFGPIKIIY